jgi:hypothetical protein
MLRIRLPSEYDEESLADHLNERIEELYPALDLDVEERDMRATLLEVTITSVEIDGSTVTVYYEVEYDAYYGCKDLDSGGSYEEEMTGEMGNGYISFSRHISPERLAPNEEL